MNKQQLANKIWESANKMRSKIEANEYKDYILGFIFYKYLSDTEVKELKNIGMQDEDIKKIDENNETVVKHLQKNIGYFISYKNLYSTWLDMGTDFDISNVTEALSAFSRLIGSTHKKVFENIFNTLETGLSKLGDTSSTRTKAVSDLLQLIKDIPMDGKQDYDVLGFIYEYLISMFAANAGKKAGEFYTPHEVSLLMSEIVANHLAGRETIEIYDSTSGSGSLLINIGRSAAKYMSDKNAIKYYAQELKENTYNLTRMNLIMRGIKPDNIVVRNGDTLAEDWPIFDENDRINTYERLRVDAVVSNPPYSQNWDSANKQYDPRYAEFGVAPKGKADYAFLLHDLYHIKPDGIMTIVLPHGVLFRGGEEGEIRRKLIEKNHIDTIIGLPANIFFGTGIPTIIMVLKQPGARDNTDILFIDASKGFEKEGKNNKLRACDIKKISDTVRLRESIEKFSRIVSIDEIRENDYNLNIPRYVDSSEKAESWDIYASMFGGIPQSEISALNEYWTVFPQLKNALFVDAAAPYTELKSDNIKETIAEHSDITNFKKNFAADFEGFEEYLRKELIVGMESVAISREESVLSENIFERLKDSDIIDKYDVYQILDNEWGKIAVDLEIIQTEGFGVTKKVDPNLVLKKKNNKEEEVQDGWVGHVIPFELAQKQFLTGELASIKTKESRIAEISSLCEEIADSFTEEEKSKDVFNEGSIVAKEIAKTLKELGEGDDNDTKAFIDKLKQADGLLKEEKKLKAEIKTETSELIAKTKELIENLTDAQVYELLEIKWLRTMISEIYKMPEIIIDNLIKKLQALESKYKVTYFEVEKEIKETEALLCNMIDELEGNEFDMKGLSELKSLLKGE